MEFVWISFGFMWFRDYGIFQREVIGDGGLIENFVNLMSMGVGSCLSFDEYGTRKLFKGIFRNLI